MPARLAGGIEGTLQRFHSDYAFLMNGGLESYRQAADGFTPGRVDQGGTARRFIMGAYVQGSLQLFGARLVLGTRVDEIRDRFEDDLRATLASSHHGALSPRAGINIPLSLSSVQNANIFASISRTSKAPTPDQLYDQRPIPIPFPPYSISVSNSELRPQHGTNVDVGIYYETLLFEENVQQTITLSAYTISMEDELDFDVQRFKYINIGQSIHRGFDADVRIRTIDDAMNFSAAYGFQYAEARQGANAGK